MRHETDTMTALPPEILTIVERYIAETGEDFTSPEAMAWECEVHSRGLAAMLRDAGYEAGVAQIWMERVPEALSENERAGGHYVCIVDWETDDDYATFRVDLTAAQFPEMGWTGPRARAV